MNKEKILKTLFVVLMAIFTLMAFMEIVLGFASKVLMVLALLKII